MSSRPSWPTLHGGAEECDASNGVSINIDVPCDSERLWKESRRLPPTCRFLTLRMRTPQEDDQENDPSAAEGLLRFIRALPKCLEKLSFYVENCEGSFSDVLAGIAGAKLPSLKELRIGFSKCNDIDENAVSRFADAFTLNLDKLHIEFRICDRIGDRCLACLLFALQAGLHHVKLVFIACDQITDSGMTAFVRDLPSNSCKVDVSVSLCDLDPSTAEMTRSLEKMREWQEAMTVQVAALAAPDDAECVSAVVAYLNHDCAIVRRGAVEALSKACVTESPHVAALTQVLTGDDYDMWPNAVKALATSQTITTATRPRFHTARCLGSWAMMENRQSIVRLQPSPGAGRAAHRITPSSGRGRLSSREQDGRFALHRIQIGTEPLRRWASAGDLGTTKRSSPNLQLSGIVGRNIDVAEAVEVLAARLADRQEDTEARVAAAAALGWLGPLAQPRHSVILSQCMADEDHDVRMSSATALGRLGCSTNSHVASLIDQLGDGSGTVDIDVLELLGAVSIGMGAAAAPLVATFAKCLENENWEVRAAAANVIGQTGLAGIPYGPDLVRHLGDIDLVGSLAIDVGLNVRQASSRALVSLPSAALESLPSATLAHLALDTSVGDALQAKAASVFTGLAEEDRAAALVVNLNDSAWELRTAAAEALASIATLSAEAAKAAVAEIAAPALLSLLVDTSLNVRMSAADALIKLELSDKAVFGPEAWADIALIPHGIKNLSKHAFEVLHCFDDHGHLATVSDALAKFFDHPNVNVRVKAIEAFVARQDTSSVAASIRLLSCLADEDGVVRACAAAGLLDLKPGLAASPPEVCGHLLVWEKVVLKAKMYQRRYFSLRAGYLTWWKEEPSTENSATASIHEDLGFVDFVINPCRIITAAEEVARGNNDRGRASSSVQNKSTRASIARTVLDTISAGATSFDSGLRKTIRGTPKATRFCLTPVEGDWVMTVCRGISPNSCLYFDAANSEHCAEAWVFALQTHMAYSQRADVGSRPKPPSNQRKLSGSDAGDGW
eukprot:TRINITY_DN37408_c0_g1_i1.p1 TRINITY_DN37408_c0_g1~~TRINITY_DN37408_c0_g1_i1.p1  ORF type:complete len:1017 (+),score=159.20 TRINITY_DN37408_c0_g1_i1:76-3126(+)